MPADFPIKQIETSRLALRPFARGDHAELVRIAGLRSIADTTISVPHPFTPDDALALIERARDPSGSSLSLAIEERSSKALLGYVGLHHIDRDHGQAEISFWIDPDRQGEGIAKEAVGGLIGHAFGAMELHRIEAYFMSRNPASGRLLASLGFQEEGFLRQRVVKWGRREDVRLWALLATDWRS